MDIQQQQQSSAPPPGAPAQAPPQQQPQQPQQPGGMSSGSGSSRAPRPPSLVSTNRTSTTSNHSRGQSSEGPSQPPSPMTYFPNPSTFTSSPNPQYLPSIQTSPSLASARLGASSMSHSSLSTDDESYASVTTRTPRVVAGQELQSQQQQFYYPTPTPGQSWRAESVPPIGMTVSPRVGGNRRSASVATARSGNPPPANRGSTNPPSSYGATGLHLGPPPGSAGLPTTGGLDALGLGPAAAVKAAAAVDPRRIASTSGIGVPGPSRANRRRGVPDSPASAGFPLPNSLPHTTQSHPGTAHATPRHRGRDREIDGHVPTSAHTYSGSGDNMTSDAPSYGRSSRAGRGAGAPPSTSRPAHKRHASVTSSLAPVAQSSAEPRSPAGSVFRRRLHTVGSSIGFGRPAQYDGNDSDYGEYDGEDDGKRANGTRVWYSSYITIDWLHDAIKESSRVRHLRHRARRSWRGAIRNAWDRFQGWLVVTLVGVITACIAFLIIRSEMALFDLKEGYCTNSWGTAKRLCCAPRSGRGHPDPSSGEEEPCGDWVEWGRVFGSVKEANPDAAFWSEPEFIVYFIIAVGLACTASALTYYLTSSATHTTSKDSAFLGPDLPPSPRSASQLKSPNERQPLLLEGAPEVEEPKPEPQRPVLYMAAGSGIPEIKTILSGFVIHGYLGLSTLVVKSAGLAMSVGSGLSLGKEGPFVHIASCIANIVCRLFVKYEQNEGKRREILSTACAAGVAVSFGAPIGGVLFSLEEVSTYFPPKVMWRSFWCAAVAAITLKALNPYGNGSIVLFAVTYTKEYHYWEFAVFIVLGLFGGLYGAFFSRCNIWWSKHVRKGTWLSRHPIIEVALVTGLTTVVSFLNPYTRLGGTELVAKLFAECTVDKSSSLCVGKSFNIGPIVYNVGIALIIKALLTIVTFGIVLPAGIFIPSLVIGACFGRIVGIWLEWLEYHHPYLPIFEVCRNTGCVVPGIYAMVGAAATLAGVTRTTVSLAVIVFELTGTLNYVVPVMLAILVAKTTADAIEKRGIYELVIELKKLPYLSNKEEYLWGSALVSEVVSGGCVASADNQMDRDAPTLRADKPHTVRELTGKLLELVRLGYADAGFPVLVKEPAIDREGRPTSVLRVLGFLGINEVEHALTALADEPDASINLMPDDTVSMPRSSMLSIFSFRESSDGRGNPYDLSQYLDRAPITVQVHSPLELVQELFIKLGARQIIVADARGQYRGALYKKQWIAFLDELEHGEL
ncbi:hypothetical protein Q8F55_002259 [Vanrija albida]|uniref:Chloride channel protein n=1 Tax=Vanrija albida TaxID=181172 RepID=A0ABR3Q9A5_9TREE